MADNGIQFARMVSMNATKPARAAVKRVYGRFFFWS